MLKKPLDDLIPTILKTEEDYTAAKPLGSENVMF